MAFDVQTVGNVESAGATVVRINGKVLVSNLNPGADCVINFQDKSGKQQQLVVLSVADAKHMWLLGDKGKQHLYLSKSNLYQKENAISATGNSGKMEFSVFPALGKLLLEKLN